MEPCENSGQKTMADTAFLCLQGWGPASGLWDATSLRPRSQKPLPFFWHFFSSTWNKLFISIPQRFCLNRHIESLLLTKSHPHLRALVGTEKSKKNCFWVVKDGFSFSFHAIQKIHIPFSLHTFQLNMYFRHISLCCQNKNTSGIAQ